MLPRERPKQEHKHCEAIDGKIKDPQKKPTLVISDIGVENQEEEWNGIVSELYQWSRNK